MSDPNVGNNPHQTMSSSMYPISTTGVSTTGAFNSSIFYGLDPAGKNSLEGSHTEYFSISATNSKIEEFKRGKYSDKYIIIYLDFIHLNNFITNLQYMEFKEEIEKFLELKKLNEAIQ